MGLTDEMVEGYWRWTSTGSLANFTNWHPGQPDNYGSGEDCVYFSASMGNDWDDGYCDSVFTPLCEKGFVGYHLNLSYKQKAFMIMETFPGTQENLC